MDVDVTDLVLAARTNDPRVVAALGDRFPTARLHVPLSRLEGVRNRPETAVELGAELPVHWLRLDTGEKAIPLFTTVGHCRECAERLGWETDRQSIKALALPGDITLKYLSAVLVSPGVERAILNPLSSAELHLARTEVEALAAGQPVRSLWFYARDGKLRRPVSIEGGSLIGNLLSKADRALGSLGDSGPPPIPILEASAPFEPVEPRGPLEALTAEIHRIASDARVGSLDVTVTQRGGAVELDATPRPAPELLDRLKRAAETALAHERGDARLTFRIDEAAIVVSSSSNLEPSPPPPPRPSRPETLGYIPLEPEDVAEKD